MTRLKKAIVGFAVAAVLAVSGGVVANATDVEPEQEVVGAWPSMCC